jgi:outer membrane lipoprotein-sorting protein
MRRSSLPILLIVLCLSLLAVSRPAIGTGPVDCTDYRGSGRIRVLLQPDLPVKSGEARNGLDIRLKQIFLRPDRMLLSVDFNGLQQQELAEGSTEQVYQPAMGMVIEKRYLHLDKAHDNPIIAIQTSIVALGRLLREAKSAHSVGKEKVLGFDCDILEADSKELIAKMGGLISGGNGGLHDGKTRAWVASGYAVPVKLEMYTAAGNLGMSMAMDELRFNTGVKPEDLRLDVPTGTKKVSIDVDLAESDWQQKMGQDLRKAVAALNSARPPS